jgi:hypothetical protein
MAADAGAAAGDDRQSAGQRLRPLPRSSSDPSTFVPEV